MKAIHNLILAVVCFVVVLLYTVHAKMNIVNANNSITGWVIGIAYVIFFYHISRFQMKQFKIKK